jgi:protein-tyrosine-phosphatase
MAEALLKQRLEREGLTGWEVESAGTWTVDGAPASRYAIQVMAERGVDIATHRSRQLHRVLLEQADVVLVMTQGHAEALRLEFPDQADKVFLLSEMKEGQRYDIEDPYGRPLEVYQTCVEEIAALIDEGFDSIRAITNPR